MLTVLPSLCPFFPPSPPPCVCPFIRLCIPLWLSCDWYRAYGAFPSADCSASCEKEKVERVMSYDWAFIKGIIGTPYPLDSSHIQGIALDLQGNGKWHFLTSGRITYFALSAHSKKVLGLNPPANWNLFVWSLLVLSVPVWISAHSPVTFGYCEILILNFPKVWMCDRPATCPGCTPPLVPTQCVLWTVPAANDPEQDKRFIRWMAPVASHMQTVCMISHGRIGY